MLMRLVAVSSLLVLALGLPAFAAPRLVADLNTQPATDPAAGFGWGGRDALLDGDTVTFSAGDPAHGIELWRTDGTAAGTERLTDICPGRCDAKPGDLHLFKGRLYFAADDGVSGRELWSSDGTRVRDLCPGPCSGNPSDLADTGSALLFLTASGGSQRLWRSDGTRQGTVPVATICALPSYGNCATGLRRVGNRVLFAVSAAGRWNLWSTNGTAAGTRPLTAAGGSGLFSPDLFVNGPFAYFVKADALWRSDGTPAGTRQVRTFRSLGVQTLNLSSVHGLFWQGRLYLVLQDYTGPALVASDGTTAGTVLAAKLPASLRVGEVAPLAGQLLFLAADGNSGSGTGVWRLKGTPATVEKIFGDSNLLLLDLVTVGHRAVFRAEQKGGQPDEIWVTDGSAAGTSLLREVTSGFFNYQLLSTGNQALWIAGIPPRELWATDGTAAGTAPVKDFAAGPGSSGPLAQTAIGTSLVFSARTSPLDAPLFRSDGSAAGTVELSDQATWAGAFAPAGNRWFFVSQRPDPTQTYQEPNGLWSVTDSLEVTQVSSTLVTMQPAGALGGNLLFAGEEEAPAFPAPINSELWASDGSAARLVKEIDPFQARIFHFCGPESSSPGPGVVLSPGLLVFAADDGVHGRELWASDGTEAGTRLVLDINPRTLPQPPPDVCDNRRQTGLPSNPQDFVPLGQGAVFTADDGTHGRELWWTDGTAAGTHIIRDITPGAPGSEPAELAAFQGAVYFFGPSPVAGQALWRTDGTAAGTVLIHNLEIGGTPSWAHGLTTVPSTLGGRLFFVVDNEITGPELWTSRGTAVTTHLVTDLRPGARGSYPQALTAVGSVLVFAATDGVHGLEPWRSDGTAAGTRPLGDLNPGPDASSPGPFTRAGNFVFTGAYDPEHGREPWAIPLDEILAP
jgi:ELWxxDGT repeat protein